ncbi:MAG: diguanylate cyclase [Burkholderiales bacterium]
MRVSYYAMSNIAKVLALLALLLLSGISFNAAPSPSVLSETSPVDLLDNGALFLAGDEAFPAGAQDLLSWLALRKPASRISLFGGSYWLYAETRTSSAITAWVLDPNNTVIENIEARIYGPAGDVQQRVTGYRGDHSYMLHYGKAIHLNPNSDYRVLIKFSSPYFASIPRFEVMPEHDYLRKVVGENVLILACLGAVMSLALFNLMLFVSAGDKSQFYYALYLIIYCIAWAFVFHIPSELFGWRNLRVHYIPFFLLPVFSGLFCIDFLKLRERFPLLAKLCYATIALSLLLLPSSFLALPYAHTLATIVIGFWLPLAITCGIMSWRSGFRPARFFTIAFIALLVPGFFIIPANIGLMPDIVENSELLALVGGTIDAVLLAFALADKIKLLGQEKDIYLGQLNHALRLARTDSMTGIGNRHAFDQMFEQEQKLSFMSDSAEQPMLILVDLDGLKMINDKHGHTRGDDLLRTFATALQRLEGDGISCYRLGGDEFAICALKHDEAKLREKLEAIERSLAAGGFPESGVSFGVAYANETHSPADWFNSADSRMYEHKALKKSGRHSIVMPF